MESIKLSVEGQLELFKEPNAAEIFLWYASIAEEVFSAIHLKAIDNRPHRNSAFEKIWFDVFSSNKRNNPEVLQMLVKTLTREDVSMIYANGGYLRKETQMKFFEVFPKDVIKKIILIYCKDLWNICDDAQMKTFEVFSHDEAKEIFLNTKISLCDQAQSYVFENFDEEDAIEILANNAAVGNKLLQKILDTFSNEKAKSFIIALLEKGGQLVSTFFDMEQGIEHPQMLIIKNFSTDDATEIFEKIMYSGDVNDVTREELNDSVVAKIIDDFPTDKAQHLISMHINERDGYIREESLLKIMDVFPKPEAKELLCDYMKNDGEFGSKVQKKILSTFSPDDATEILLKDINNGSYFADDVILRIIDMLPSKNVREIISAYMTGGMFNDEIIINIIVTLRPEDAAFLIKKYKRNGGHLCHEAQIFLKRHGK